MLDFRTRPCRRLAGGLLDRPEGKARGAEPFACKRRSAPDDRSPRGEAFPTAYPDREWTVPEGFACYNFTPRTTVQNAKRETP